jgi:hypothetical protein
VFALLVGCGFQPADVTGMGSGMPDADPRPSCAATATPPGQPTTSLGASGTSNGILQPDLDCAAGELPIGVGFESTTLTRPELGNERAITAIHVQCGTVTVHVDGKSDRVVAETLGWTGNDCAWGSTVVAPITQCPDNTVLVGLTANSGATTMFNSAALSCRLLLASGQLGAVVPPTDVVDTGSYGNRPQSAQCPSGTVVVSFAMRGNCGVDQLTPRCAPLACE